MSIKIRGIGVQDAARLAEIYGQPAIQQNTLQLPLPTADYWHQKILNYPTIGHIGFVAERDGIVVGNLTLFTETSVRLRHVVSFGLAVDTHYTRQGIAQQLIDFGQSYAFDWLAARRIELEVFADNHAAITLYHKLGFVTEGVARQAAFKQGRYQDVIVMAKLVEEYRQEGI